MGLVGGEGQPPFHRGTAFSSASQFLQDTLDTLFGILDENSQKYGSKVFDSLVSGRPLPRRLPSAAGRSGSGRSGAWEFFAQT